MKFKGKFLVILLLLLLIVVVSIFVSYVNHNKSIEEKYYNTYIEYIGGINHQLKETNEPLFKFYGMVEQLYGMTAVFSDINKNADISKLSRISLELEYEFFTLVVNNYSTEKDRLFLATQTDLVLEYLKNDSSIEENEIQELLNKLEYNFKKFMSKTHDYYH